MATINVNGISLYYREAGSGEPLLLIHGTGFNADVWDKVFDLLARDYRTIAYDRRAYQRSQGSPPPTASYGYQQGEDIAALLQALHAAPATLLGWSAGGIHALHATLNHPDCVERLVLYEPPLYPMRYIDLPFFTAFFKINVLKAVGRYPAAAAVFTHTVLAYQDGRNSYEQLSAEIRAKMAGDADTALTEIDATSREEPKSETLSKQINVPVTLLLGDQSPVLFHKAANNLAGVLHNAPIVRLPGANHFAHVDQPHEFVKAVKGALA